MTYRRPDEPVYTRAMAARDLRAFAMQHRAEPLPIRITGVATMFASFVGELMREASAGILEVAASAIEHGSSTLVHARVPPKA